MHLIRPAVFAGLRQNPFMGPFKAGQADHWIKRPVSGSEYFLSPVKDYLAPHCPRRKI
jgi:hypothetical protein